MSNPLPILRGFDIVPSTARQNLTNFWDDDAQDDGYDSDGKIGPFYDALEEEGEQ